MWCKVWVQFCVLHTWTSSHPFNEKTWSVQRTVHGSRALLLLAVGFGEGCVARLSMQGGSHRAAQLKAGWVARLPTSRRLAPASRYLGPSTAASHSDPQMRCFSLSSACSSPDASLAVTSSAPPIKAPYTKMRGTVRAPCGAGRRKGRWGGGAAGGAARGWRGGAGPAGRQ